MYLTLPGKANVLTSEEVKHMMHRVTHKGSSGSFVDHSPPHA
jgi:hypothetical protein